MIFALLCLERVRLEKPETNSRLARNEPVRLVGSFQCSGFNHHSTGIRQATSHLCRDGRKASSSVKDSDSGSLHGTPLGLRCRGQRYERWSQAKARRGSHEANELTSPRQAGKLYAPKAQNKNPRSAAGIQSSGIQHKTNTSALSSSSVRAEPRVGQEASTLTAFSYCSQEVQHGK